MNTINVTVVIVVFGTAYLGRGVYAASLVFMLAIYAFTSERSGMLGRGLQHPVCRHLGTYSYSIYMIHALFSAVFSNVAVYILKVPTSGPDSAVTSVYSPLINLLMLAAVLACSIVTFRYVEEPWRARVKEWVRMH